MLNPAHIRGKVNAWDINIRKQGPLEGSGKRLPSISIICQNKILTWSFYWPLYYIPHSKPVIMPPKYAHLYLHLKNHPFILSVIFTKISRVSPGLVPSLFFYLASAN